MSNYNAINNTNSQQPPNRYYPAAIPPDPLQRYGSGHLDLDIFGISVSRLAVQQQMEFVRRVIIITTGQFIVLALMVYFIVKVCPLFDWLKTSTWTWYIPLIPTFILSLIIIWQLWSQYFHLSIPTRTSLLALFSISMSLVVSNIVSKLIYQEGMSVIIMSLFGMCACLLYTFQKRFPFSGAFPFVCSLGAVCLCSPWMRHIYDMDPLEILYPMTIACFICVYIVLELYYIMKNVISDDYLLANVYFFIDLVYPIRFIHHVCELTDNMDVFPDILYPGR